VDFNPVGDAGVCWYACCVYCVLWIQEDGHYLAKLPDGEASVQTRRTFYQTLILSRTVFVFAYLFVLEVYRFPSVQKYSISSTKNVSKSEN
jgi:hypothetical protein